MDEEIRDEPQPEQHKNEYEEPSLIDLEDLEDVSGGCFICDTGGSSEV